MERCKEMKGLVYGAVSLTNFHCRLRTFFIYT